MCLINPHSIHRKHHSRDSIDLITSLSVLIKIASQKEVNLSLEKSFSFTISKKTEIRSIMSSNFSPPIVTDPTFLVWIFIIWGKVIFCLSIYRCDNVNIIQIKS